MNPSKPGQGTEALADREPASQASRTSHTSDASHELHAAALLALGDEVARQLEALAHETLADEPFAPEALGQDGPAAPGASLTPLAQVAGALRFAGEQGGEALVGFLAKAMARHADGPEAKVEASVEVPVEATTELKAIMADCAVRLRHALRARALGRRLAVAHLLPCWQRLTALSADADADTDTHPCQLLTLAPGPVHAAPKDADEAHALPELQVAIDLLVCEVDRALLDFLRSRDDSLRQHAAKTIAVALAGIAARQLSPQDALRWRALQAFAGEVSAGQRYELTHAKRILSATGRQVRQVQRMLHHVPPDSLLREALFEIAQHPCLTPLAQQVADVYELPSQLPLLEEQEVGVPADDEAFEHAWAALQAAIGGPAGLASATAWSSANERSLAHMAAACAAGPAAPMASGLMRAIAEATGESIAAIEHQIDADGERGPSLSWFDEVSDLVSQIDACTVMLDHAGLRRAAGELNAALARLSPVVAGSGEVTKHGELLSEFAARLVALEAKLALLPFSPSDNGTRSSNRTGTSQSTSTGTGTGTDSTASRDTGVGLIPLAGPSPAASSLLQIFISEARARLDSLSVALSAWKTMPAAGLPLQASIDAHAIAGSSATVGWAALQALAQPLELACSACEVRAFAEDDAGLLAEAIAGLRCLLDEGINMTADGSGHCIDAQLIVRLHALARPPVGEHAGEQAGKHAGDRVDERIRAEVGMSGDAHGNAHGDAQAAEPELAEDFADAPDIELRALFDEEAADLLPQLHHAMRAWLSRPEDPAPPSHLMRVLHTLKGSARMAGQTALGDAVHHIESQVADIVDARSASAESLQQLQRKLDDALQFTAIPSEPARGMPDPVREAAAELPALPAAPADPVLSSRAESKEARRTEPATGTGASPGQSTSANTGASHGQLRVPVDLLGRMTDAAAGLLSGLHQQADELRALRQGITDVADNLARLRAQLREMEIEADARIDAHELRNGDAAFDPLEFDRYTRVHELTRAMTESVADLAEVQRIVARQSDTLAWSCGLRQRHARALHADLLQAGTSPFGSLQLRLSQALRQAVRDMGGRGDAEASLVLEGGELALDRSLLERLAAPLEHLIRNAIAHGIEPAAERERLGKPRGGTLRISLSRTANQWRLEVADDGRGLDAARIRARAAAMGLSVPTAFDDADHAAASELIFARGLSTSEALTPLAGRGVGMDAVRAAVQSLGGAIEVRSEPGRGCCFVLALPLTLAILPVLVCRAGPHLIGVPSAMVEQVLKLDGPAFAAATEGEGFAWQGQSRRWRNLATLLGAQPSSSAGAARRKTLLLLAQAGGRLALVVDAIDARRELTLNDPGPQLLSVPGMIAASPAADGRIVLVMNPFSLAPAGQLSATAQASASPEAAASTTAKSDENVGATSAAADDAPPAVQPPAILVVDDSLTVRRATQRLLQRQGYAVLLARDGTEALAMLAAADGDGDGAGPGARVGARVGEEDEEADPIKPQAVLLDIEMPKMDGFELLSVLRGDARWQQLPVVMITSRTADRHRERALQLGANAYVGKPYREDELLALLSGLMPPVPATGEAAATTRSCAA